LRLTSTTKQFTLVNLCYDNDMQNINAFLINKLDSYEVYSILRQHMYIYHFDYSMYYI